MRENRALQGNRPENDVATAVPPVVVSGKMQPLPVVFLGAMQVRPCGSLEISDPYHRTCGIRCDPLIE